MGLFADFYQKNSRENQMFQNGIIVPRKIRVKLEKEIVHFS